MKKLDLAFLSFSQAWGGLESNLISVASGLQQRGHTILLIAPTGSPLARSARSLLIPVSLLEPSVRYFDLLAASRLATLLTRRGISILTATQSSELSTCGLATLFSRGLSLVYYQQMQSGINKRDFIHRWVYSRVSSWVTLTEEMKRSVIRYTTFVPDNIRVVPNGIDLERFDPRLVARHTSRVTLGIPTEAFLVAVVGRLDKQKGQEYFLEAASLVLKKYPDTHFAIVGDETKGEEGYAQELAQKVDQLGIRKHVTFLSHTSSIEAFLSLIDLFVLPSLSETFGLVLLEAMAMRKPVIATNAGGVPEIIADGYNGLLVTPAHADELSNAIMRLIEHPEQRSLLVDAARKTVEEQYDQKVQINRFERMYQELQKQN
jgi:D-inositol-3-phosphate glycosyltransferase